MSEIQHAAARMKEAIRDSPGGKHYEIRLEKHDGEYVALVDEFPSLSWTADTESAARRGLMDLLRFFVADARSHG